LTGLPNALHLYHPGMESRRFTVIVRENGSRKKKLRFQKAKRQNPKPVSHVDISDFTSGWTEEDVETDPRFIPATNSDYEYEDHQSYSVVSFTIADIFRMTQHPDGKFIAQS
jgi:hypothetical protein